MVGLIPTKYNNNKLFCAMYTEGLNKLSDRCLWTVGASKRSLRSLKPPQSNLTICVLVLIYVQVVYVCGLIISYHHVLSFSLKRYRSSRQVQTVGTSKGPTLPAFSPSPWFATSKAVSELRKSFQSFHSPRHDSVPSNPSLYNKSILL